MPITSQFRMIDRNGKQETSVTFSCEVLIDEEPDLSYLTQNYSETAKDDPDEAAKYRAQDKKRLAAYYRGDWRMTGIRAKAEITVPAGGNSFAMYTLSSPGVWGVESDCGEDYRKELYGEELSALKAHMRDMATAFQAITD